MKLIRCKCGGRPRTWMAWDSSYQVQCDRCKKRGEFSKIKERAQQLWNEVEECDGQKTT